MASKMILMYCVKAAANADADRYRGTRDGSGRPIDAGDPRNEHAFDAGLGDRLAQLRLFDLAPCADRRIGGDGLSPALREQPASQ